MAAEPFLLDLDPWRWDRALLDGLALLLTGFGREFALAGFDLEVCRLLVFFAAALAGTAQGAEVQDKAVAYRLEDAPERELLNVSFRLEDIGADRPFDTPSAHELLELLGKPFTDEIARRGAGN